MTNTEFNEGFRRRTKKFSVDIIHLCEGLPASRVNAVIIYQLCKAATSVGANFRAFCQGRSAKEKYAKICIVVEEADETLYWLEIIHDSGKDSSAHLKHLLQESLEIVKITAKIKSSLAP